ncbi:MAG: glucodextranase DOMON-like domain-containing protein [Gammaproteobacteria bacterium]
MTTIIRHLLAGCALGAMAAAPAFGASIEFKDPTGDDKGPGNYVYPTDAVYAPGSFDITSFEVTPKGKNVEFKVCVNSKLDDPWGMGVGFAVQMVIVFINTGALDAGQTNGLPGLNIQFGPESTWNRAVILSPQQQSRVMAEAKMKSPFEVESGALLVPRKTLGKGKCISGRVPIEDLATVDASGMQDPFAWSYQVVMQSNEGFPDKSDLLTRKVNEYEGQHRFGGGNDMNCDPHVMDLLAPPAQGTEAEIQAQYDMLAYKCDADGNPVEMATLQMINATGE